MSTEVLILSRHDDFNGPSGGYLANETITEFVGNDRRLWRQYGQYLLHVEVAECSNTR